MPTNAPNKIRVPVGSDAYALTADLLAMAKSANVVVTVTNAAERDALPKVVGMVVGRTDLNGLMEVWDGTTWRSIVKRRHAEFTGSASPVGGADWGFGVFTADATAADNNTFCVPGGNSRLTFTEPGVYSIQAKFGASSSPGFYYGAIKNSANTDVYADGDNGNGVSWGASVAHPCLRIPAAGTDILIGLKTAVTCTASIRLTVQKISD